MKFPLPLCHLGQAYVRLCSIPMALHLCSDTCSSLPCKPISRGKGSRERKALSPFLPHLQCSLRCRNTSAELGSFSFHQSTMCLPRKFILSPSYHICRQRQREWLAPGHLSRTEVGLSLQPSWPGSVSSERGILHPHHSPIERGFSNPLQSTERWASATEAFGGFCRQEKNAATKDWGLLELCSRGKGSTCPIQKLILILMSVSKSS